MKRGRNPQNGLAACLAGLLASACAFEPSLDLLLVAESGLSDARVLYIHGAGDDARTWATGLLSDDQGDDYALDWSADAADRQAAPSRGYRIGQALAQYMDDAPRTIYAHSAGAWVAQGMADGLAELGVASAPDIVFLDPFTALSIAQPFAGSRMLGKNTASVETWYTTLDPIPFTAGAVAEGSSTCIDDKLAVTGTDAHWAVIDWYMAWRQ